MEIYTFDPSAWSILPLLFHWVTLTYPSIQSTSSVEDFHYPAAWVRSLLCDLPATSVHSLTILPILLSYNCLSVWVFPPDHELPEGRKYTSIFISRSPSIMPDT